MKENKKSRAKKYPVREVSRGEMFASCTIISLLCLIVVWLFSQRNVYDPQERDITFEMLEAGSEIPELYKAPVKKYQEAGGRENTEALKNESLGLFPKAILAGGWELGSRIKYFNPKNLYVKINGEAIKFLRQGFRSLHYLVLRKTDGNEEISVELYDQGDEKGSIGVFSEYLSGTRKVEQESGSVFILTSAGAIGRKGPFFFRISGNLETETIQSKSSQIASAFSQLPEREKAAAAGFLVLNKGMDIDPKRIEYQGENVFQFDFARDFWFGNPGGNITGRIFIHHDKDGGKIENLFKKIVTGQEPDYTVIEQTGDYALLQHSFLHTYFAMRFRGNYIYGIDNERDRKNAENMLDRLDRVIEDEK